MRWFIERFDGNTWTSIGLVVEGDQAMAQTVVQALGGFLNRTHRAVPL